MDTPAFVELGELTAQGQELKDYIERQIAESQQLYEAQGDVGVLNAMSGSLKHYYVNVLCMEGGASGAAERWMEEFRYGAGALWGAYLAEKQQEEKAEKQTAATLDLAARIAKLEEALAEAVVAQEPPAPKRKAKVKAEEAAPPAETDAEEDADEESDEEA